MKFAQFKREHQAHTNAVLSQVDHLFVVDLDKDKLWEAYLESFPQENNQIYRERREHDCSACRSFVKHFGNVVALKDGVLTTMWDFITTVDEYRPSVAALCELVRSHKITDVFVTNENHFGVDHNHELIDGKLKSWEHLFISMPSKFVMGRSNDSVETVMAKHRDQRNVFKRSLDEITPEAVATVLELIAQNSLYKGEEWKPALIQFQSLWVLYSRAENKDFFAWEQSMKIGGAVGKIRNHSIGTLLQDLSADVDLDVAVRKYEAVVAPSNYKRPKAIFTQAMLEKAQEELKEAGLIESLGRRFAVLDDISVRDILFADRSVQTRMKGADPFSVLSKEVAVSPKNFDRVETIGIDAFVKDVLPTVTKLEAYVENSHMGNLVSLIAPKVKNSKSLFKWNNGFSWTYAGNITDSMKERVKAAGGRVDGVLRFSIQWNDENDNPDDLDAHCQLPSGREIYFGKKQDNVSGGNLDVDIRVPNGVAVENITWPDIRRMKDGTYLFFVHNYAARGAQSGFTAEVEFDGQVFSFNYPRPVRHNEAVTVATVTLKDGKFSIKEDLPSTTSSRKAWTLDTMQFYPVTLCLLSPNHWESEVPVGNKHFFFMLKDCLNTETPSGFFNEFLPEELSKHKRVLEALSNRMRVEPSDDQLSGLGFSSTQRNSLTVRAEGQTTRLLKITF